MANKQVTVVHVSRKQLAICGPAIAGMPVVTLGGDVVKALEVIDQQKLSQVVMDFGKSTGQSMGNRVMVLGEDICFERDIDRKPEVQIEVEAQKFLESIPVLSVSSKVYETEKMYRIIAISRDLYEGLRQAFEQAGYVVSVVVPNFVLGAVGLTEQFDEKACRILVNHLDQVASYGFELEERKEATFTQQKEQFLNKYKVAITIFAVVSVVVCIVVAFVVTRRPGT